MKKNKILSIVCALAMMMSMFSMFVVAEAAATTSGLTPKLTFEVTEHPTNQSGEFKIALKYEGGAADTVVPQLSWRLVVDTAKYTYVKYEPKDISKAANYNTTQNILAFSFASADEPAPNEGTVGIITLSANSYATDTIGTNYEITADAITNVKMIIADNADNTNKTTYTPADTMTVVPPTATLTEKKVDSKPVITGVTVSPKTATVKPGESTTFTATVAGTNGYDAAKDEVIPFDDKVTWSVDNADVAEIDANGKLTVKDSAQAGATVTVKATSVGDATKSDSATVKVGGAAVELSVSANSDVKDYPVQKVSISKAADADAADVEAFKTAVSDKKAVVLVTGKTADDVVVGSAYVIVDGTAIADGIDAAAVELGSVGVMGATKCEVSLIVDGNALVTAK
jgi:hypothetical protein